MGRKDKDKSGNGAEKTGQPTWTPCGACDETGTVRQEKKEVRDGKSFSSWHNVPCGVCNGVGRIKLR